MSDEAASYYNLLGVVPSAKADTIRRAFRQRIRTVHPDVNKAPDAAILVTRLTEAFRVLNNPIARSAYDDELRRQRLLHLAQVDALMRAQSPGSAVPVRQRPLWWRMGASLAALLLIAGIGAGVWQLAMQWGIVDPDATIVTARAPVSRWPVAVAAQTLAPEFRHEAALAVPPVEVDAVQAAMRKFRTVSWSRGMSGAAVFSRRCHDLAGRLRTVASADFCAAFDHAGYLVEGGADDPASRAAAGYFIDRHTDQARFFAGLDIEQTLVESHLDRLRASFPPITTPGTSASSPLQPVPAG